jgi:2-methylcitrate dehydratase
MPDTYNPLPRLIDFAASLRYEDLPDNVVHETKRRVIDSLATAFGALADPRVVERWTYLSQRPVAYEAGGWAYGVDRKLSLCDAAFLNSTLTRWLDFNDTYLAKEPAHPSDNIGGLIALSGSVPVNGKDLITAIVLAYDVQCRLTEAASLRSHGWDHVNYILIGQALAGAKLLGFDAKQTYDAVALSLSSHGAMRQAREGSYLSEQKNMAAADAVRGAMWALEKVQAGADGPAEIIEGKHGFVAQMSGPLEEEAFTDLGEHFLLADTYIKPVPMEYHGQTIVEHAMALRDQIDPARLSDIEEVLISGYEAQLTIIGDESKRYPKNKETADHSLYYAFAAPLLEGKLSFEQYRDEMLNSPDIQGLMYRTKFVEVPEWTERYYAPQAQREFRSKATVRLRNGTVLEDERPVPYGHPKNPMSDGGMEAKFESLAGVLASDHRALLDAAWSIDSTADVSALMAMIRLNVGERP